MYFVYGEYSGKATAAVGRYVNASIRANGAHFEHLLSFFSIQIQINKDTQKLTNLISSIRWLVLDFKSL
jgi:hypothetical protein